MGQEILYCTKCGKRLVGDDFTRGRAHTFNNRQYCATCVPQEHTDAHQALKGEESRKSATGRITKSHLKPVTARATAPPPPPKSGGALMIGLGLGIAAIGVIAVVLIARPSDPPPEPVPKPAAAANPTPVPAGPSKEKIAQDLKELEAKVQKLVDAEQFAAAVDLLEEARKRYPAPDWVQALVKRTKAVQELPGGLYPSLKERAIGAQLRGARNEAQQERMRVANWGRKDLLEDLDKALAAVIPHEPLPSGAKVLVRYPPGDPTRYHPRGNVKEGALVGIAYKDHVVVGWESGLEIFKVPEEGEVRVVYTTSSPALLTVILRAFNAEGKNKPFNFWVRKPEAGRPQVLKFPTAALRDWNQALVAKGGVVDNIYVRQDDPGAVLKIHEFVIFSTKP